MAVLVVRKENKPGYPRRSSPAFKIARPRVAHTARGFDHGAESASLLNMCKPRAG